MECYKIDTSSRARNTEHMRSRQNVLAGARWRQTVKSDGIHIPYLNSKCSPLSNAIKNAPLQKLPRAVHSTSKKLACEQALLFGRVKRVSRERASERRSFPRPLARAFSRGSLRLPKKKCLLAGYQKTEFLKIIVAFY